ncbi:MAG: hypothetical protein Q7W45_16000 [Bacteroidota bacterium]|nr:hypothetical protein [Bacteroidota bacterium]MDP3145481.1 hypothetical protein [Bacteroidota bacterium]MDP3556437.1 hypothetical protein [Bacteroidota bacterium]
MIKKVIIFNIILFNYIALCQTKTNYLLGFDIGRNTYPNPVQMNNEININFLYNNNYFISNAHVGYTPENNFKNIYKFGVSAGLTTKMEKRLSWNLLLGFAIIPEREYSGDRFRGGYVSLTSGIITNLFKKKNAYIGLNGFFTPYNIEYSSRNGLPRNGILSSINLSFFYKFKKKDKNQQSNSSST